MSRNEMSNRRSFLKAGAVLSAPFAAAPMVAFAGDETKARLVRLEDENAIRTLHQTWLRSINAGTADKKDLAQSMGGDKIRSIVSDQMGPPDDIKLAANGTAATGRFHCTVEIETPIAKNCTLARMAHLQGGGFLRRNESRVLAVSYAKSGNAWSIAQVGFAAAQA
jgi:hypothetical protein